MIYDGGIFAVVFPYGLFLRNNDGIIQWRGYYNQIIVSAAVEVDEPYAGYDNEHVYYDSYNKIYRYNQATKIHTPVFYASSQKYYSTQIFFDTIKAYQYTSLGTFEGVHVVGATSKFISNENIPGTLIKSADEYLYALDPAGNLWRTAQTNWWEQVSNVRSPDEGAEFIQYVGNGNYFYRTYSSLRLYNSITDSDTLIFTGYIHRFFVKNDGNIVVLYYSYGQYYIAYINSMLVVEDTLHIGVVRDVNIDISINNNYVAVQMANHEIVIIKDRIIIARPVFPNSRIGAAITNIGL